MGASHERAPSLRHHLDARIEPDHPGAALEEHSRVTTRPASQVQRQPTLKLTRHAPHGRAFEGDEGIAVAVITSGPGGVSVARREFVGGFVHAPSVEDFRPIRKVRACRP